MNTVTPRLFVAATQQNDGKTTIALGLFAALRKRLGRIGFIKPVGQRFVDVENRDGRRRARVPASTLPGREPAQDHLPIARLAAA